MSEKKMSGLRARIDYVLKHNFFIYRVYRVVMSLFFKLLGMFIPIDNKLILLTGHTRRYNDSPRVIYEYMISHPEYSGYKYVWGLEDPEMASIPGNALKVKIDTLLYFIYTLKARYWISCVNIERGLKYKKKGCVYLNTWHGVALKRVDFDDPRKNDDLSYVNIMCYESDYQRQILKKIL